MERQCSVGRYAELLSWQLIRTDTRSQTVALLLSCFYSCTIVYRYADLTVDAMLILFKIISCFLYTCLSYILVHGNTVLHQHCKFEGFESPKHDLTA